MTEYSASSRTATATAPLVLLDPIAEGTWRVLDYRDGRTGIDVLVGFVQHTTGAYAVTRLAQPDEQELCRDLLEVQELFYADARPTSAPRRR